MKVIVKVVDHQQIDRGQAQPLQAILKRTHDAVVAEVDAKIKGQRCGPPAAVKSCQVGRGVEDAANLGRDHKLAAILLAQKMADAMFALAVAVEGCGVKVAHTGVPSGLQGTLRLLFAEHIKEIAQRRGAQAKFGDVSAGLADLAHWDGGHMVGSFGDLG